MIKDNNLHSRGFTLVELLVVISIISMLMSITLPSLNKAREAGKRIVCASNMRQLTLGWTMYSMENGDKLCNPGTAWNTAGSEQDYWVADGPVPPFINPVGGTETAIKNGVLYSYFNTVGVYKCKTDRFTRLRSYSLSDAMGSGKFPGSSGFTNMGNINATSERAVFIDAEGVKAPENQKQWIADSFWPIDASGAQVQWLSWDPYLMQTSVRHGDGCNISLADGHTEFWKYKDKRTIEFVEGKIEASEAWKDNQDLEKMAKLLNVVK
jgi:prepilin-type N-terminal cleavage/methylation domain-containing protein/prepilin-type processing-associated H-X9-DG protein